MTEPKKYAVVVAVQDIDTAAERVVLARPAGTNELFTLPEAAQRLRDIVALIEAKEARQ